MHALQQIADGAGAIEMLARRTRAAVAELYGVAVRCESFIAGFEGDESQEGIDQLLVDLRAAVASVGGAA